MDETFFQGALKGGATRYESQVLRALARVYRDGTHAKFTAVFGEEYGPAYGICRGSHGEWYSVTLDSCTCAAAENGYPVCRHKVALADRLGLMERFVPDFYERFSYPAPMTQAAA